jgi:hypothetical protein
VTLDNASANGKMCEMVQRLHETQKLPAWNAHENQLMCLRHVVKLRTIDVMGHITKIAAVETTTAIWEFDPNLPGNRVLGGSLDVIAAIRTLAIKIQCSGQRMEYFNKL